MTAQTTVGEWDDLSRLSDAQRRAWVNVELGDMTVREYMNEAGLSSPGTVSKHLERARRKLGLECQNCERGRLDDELVATPDGRLCHTCAAARGFL